VDAIRRGRGWVERLDAPEGIEILEKGQFQLRWYQGSRAVYKGVGRDLQEAITARDNQIANLEAERAANAAGRKLVSDGPGRVVLAEAKQRFIQKKRLVGIGSLQRSYPKRIVKRYSSMTMRWRAVGPMRGTTMICGGKG
jgi:hypothetical protein